MVELLSRNTVGLIPQQIKATITPKGIMIAAINLNSDSTVTKDLKNIARYHSDDPQMQNLKDEFKAAQPPTGDRNNLLNYVLCCKNEKRHP